MPRLLVLAPSAFPHGGVPSWIDSVLASLTSRGWNCTLALTEGRWHSVTRYLETHSWRDVVPISNPTGSGEGRICAVADAILATEPDVVLSVNLADAFEAVRRAHTRGSGGLRHVVAIHSLEEGQFADVLSNRDVVSTALVPNRLSERLFLEMGIPPSVVAYAPCGVSISESTPARPRSDPPARRVLWAGRMENDQKRVLDLIAILRELETQGEELTFEVAGDGPELDTLRSAFKGSTLESHLRLHGWLSESAMRVLMMECSALLITSAWETGPLVAWQAMGAGLPVVTTRFLGAGLEGALRDEISCLAFDIGNIRDAARALVRVHAPDLAAGLRSVASDVVHKRYSRPVFDATLGALFDSTLAGAALRPALSQFVTSGRLHRIFGVRGGETIRRLLRRKYDHSSAGGEWPHVSRQVADPRLWLEFSHRLDRADT